MYLNNETRLKIYEDAYVNYKKYITECLEHSMHIHKGMCYFLQAETIKITDCSYEYLYTLLLEFANLIDDNLDNVLNTSYIFAVSDYKSRFKAFKTMIDKVKKLIKDEL